MTPRTNNRYIACECRDQKAKSCVLGGPPILDDAKVQSFLSGLSDDTFQIPNDCYRNETLAAWLTDPGWNIRSQDSGQDIQGSRTVIGAGIEQHLAQLTPKSAEAVCHRLDCLVGAYFIGSIPKSLHIFLARLLSISVCRGIDERLF